MFVNMKKTIVISILGFTFLSLIGCEKKAPDSNVNNGSDTEFTEFVFHEGEKDFAQTKTPGSQESAYEYQNFFLPEIDGINQPYVGDCMPYYENGVYYIYYLKDGGDSYNHSIYLTTTKDFVTYEEQETPVLEANKSGGQDAWIGTGSVIKIEDTYYLFYTGHASGNMEYNEKILLAKSDNLNSFEKVPEWEIVPDSSLGQKQDFRDPQAYFDPVTGKVVLTVTASQSGTARILKYSMDTDLTNVSYDGIIFTDPIGEVYNLECSDTFEWNQKYYLTYSAQDDTLWYAMSENPYGPYNEPVRMDGKLFYAAKHVSNGTDNYMVGWARRSESPSSTTEVQGWAGNLVVQKISQNEDGSLYLSPVDTIKKQFDKERVIASTDGTATIDAGSLYNYQDMFMAYESFMLKGSFTFDGTGNFGLAFDFGNDKSEYKMIVLNPKSQAINLSFHEGNAEITRNAADLVAGKRYDFTYIQEGSVGVFYLEGQAALTVRLYGVSGKTIRLFAENNKIQFFDLKEYTR